MPEHGVDADTQSQRTRFGAAKKGVTGRGYVNNVISTHINNLDKRV